LIKIGGYLQRLALVSSSLGYLNLATQTYTPAISYFLSLNLFSFAKFSLKNVSYISFASSVTPYFCCIALSFNSQKLTMFTFESFLFDKKKIYKKIKTVRQIYFDFVKLTFSPQSRLHSAFATLQSPFYIVQSFRIYLAFSLRNFAFGKSIFHEA
jgi:hypothetical protein